MLFNNNLSNTNAFTKKRCEFQVEICSTKTKMWYLDLLIDPEK